MLGFEGKLSIIMGLKYYNLITSTLKNWTHYKVKPKLILNINSDKILLEILLTSEKSFLSDYKQKYNQSQSRYNMW